MVYFRILIIGVFAISGFVRYEEYNYLGTTSALNEAMVSFAIVAVLTVFSIKSMLSFTPETEEELLNDCD